MEPVPKRPCRNPSNYCRLCFSQIGLECLFPASGSAKSHLPGIIASLVQIKLSPTTDAGASICSICCDQLKLFQTFRSRCQQVNRSLEDASTGSPTSVVQPKVENEVWLEVEVCNEDSTQNTIPQAGETKQSDAEKASFWSALFHDVGIIPPHISHSLEVSGFGPNASLAMIAPNTIKQIEKDMRDIVDLLVLREANAGVEREAALRKYYGPLHCFNPDKFYYLAGEVQVILAIAAAVQEHGIARYVKIIQQTQPVQQTVGRKPKAIQQIQSNAQNQPQESEVGTSEYLAERLTEKINNYYRVRNSGSEAFHKFYASLPGPGDCQVFEEESGVVCVIITCRICQKELRTLRSNNQWHISNFISHCESRHYKTEAQFGKKGRGRDKAMLARRRKLQRTQRVRPNKSVESDSSYQHEEEDEAM